jgi:hypothetical protein
MVKALVLVRIGLRPTYFAIIFIGTKIVNITAELPSFYEWLSHIDRGLRLF